MQSHWTSETSFFGGTELEKEIQKKPTKEAKTEKHIFKNAFHSLFACCSSEQSVENDIEVKKIVEIYPSISPIRR